MNCPSMDHVLIITHRGVNFADFQGSNFAPLKKAIKSAKHKLQVPEVTGEYDADALYQKLVKECGYQVAKLEDTVRGEGKTVLRTELEPLAAMSDQDMSGKGMAERKFALAKAGMLIREMNVQSYTNEKPDTTLLNLLPSYVDKSYMIIYAGLPSYTSSSEHVQAKAHSSKLATASSDSDSVDGGIIDHHHADSFRIQSRRDSGSKKGNSTIVDHRPLFEKYQFFTPGLFMGLLVTLLMLSILFVALRAISSLEVSYAAFEKEMGPQKGGKAQ